MDNKSLKVLFVAALIVAVGVGTIELNRKPAPTLVPPTVEGATEKPLSQ
jgi:hypothetical protein